ncbi:alpha/beta fold hydrolase [Demequina aurantiaca]|uniref:alpha/beta fold hydrolase n=1 Tax=Demequina aurantiaca TaxID=676200 RepID=UPI003D354764
MTALLPTGSPIVLLNAFPVDRSQWDPLIDLLADYDGDIIAFDMPGIGEMPLPDEEPSLDLIADAAVVAMREATGHDRAIWVGCSMGGYVAMSVAERHPGAIAGLALLDTRSTADDEAGVAKRLALAESLDGHSSAADPVGMAEGLVGTTGDERERLVTQVAENIARHSGDGIAWGQRAMAARPTRTEALRTVSAPAVVIVGEFDAITGTEHAAVMAEALGVDVTVIAGVGHLSALEAPQAVYDAIAPLLSA